MIPLEFLKSVILQGVPLNIGGRGDICGVRLIPWLQAPGDKFAQSKVTVAIATCTPHSARGLEPGNTVPKVSEARLEIGAGKRAGKWLTALLDSLYGQWSYGASTGFYRCLSPSGIPREVDGHITINFLCVQTSAFGASHSSKHIRV